MERYKELAEIESRTSLPSDRRVKASMGQVIPGHMFWIDTIERCVRLIVRMPYIARGSGVELFRFQTGCTLGPIVCAIS